MREETRPNMSTDMRQDQIKKEHIPFFGLCTERISIWAINQRISAERISISAINERSYQQIDVE
ncbi:hypothetical protein YC2023_085565 [Brassica napus]